MIRIALAQTHFRVGDLAGNRERIVAAIRQARDELDAHLIVFPELALSGAQPRDLLRQTHFLNAVETSLEEIAAQSHGIDVVLGLPRRGTGGQVHNSLAWLRDGQLAGHGDKRLASSWIDRQQSLHFEPGPERLLVEIRGARIALVAGSDLADTEQLIACKEAGAQLIIAASVAPFHQGVLEERQAFLTAQQQALGLPVIQLNSVGGQDELVFDGRSLAVDASGAVFGPAPLCEEVLLCLDVQPETGHLESRHWPLEERGRLATIWRVLERALADYVHDNGFSSVVLGLSGGMDSALTLALAADAIGPENTVGVMMPSRHTSELSLILASEQALLLGTRHESISIEPVYQALLRQLAEPFGQRAVNFTEENLQARARGAVLMGLSNKLGHLALAAGNKSEVAVGYTTLYGDMCGGFAPLKDVYKTLVYELGNWRNERSPAVPQGVIDRPPSAELADGQLDQDKLPPYEVLDPILEALIERGQAPAEIAASQGRELALVERIARMVKGAEFKRAQSALGPRITRQAFGRDRLLPISSGWEF